MTQPRTQTAVHTTSIPIPAIFIGTTQVVAIGASSAATSDAFERGIVRVCVTAAAYVAVGETPTATSGDLLMPAGSVEYFAVQPGQKMAFLRVVGDGSATVTEAGEIDS